MHRCDFLETVNHQNKDITDSRKHEVFFYAVVQPHAARTAAVHVGIDYASPWKCTGGKELQFAEKYSLY